MTGLHHKRLHVDWNSLIIWCGPDTKNKRGFSQLYKPSLGIVIDHPWSKDHRLYDTPLRINLHCWNWFVIIALNKDSTSQSWNRKEGTTERWRWVTWHPDHRKLCCRALYTGTKFGQTKEWECSRLRGHQGEHSK